MISMDKKYRTRDGRPVRVLCTDRKYSYPVVALVLNEHGEESVYGYTKCGRPTSGGGQHRLDLIEVKTIKRLMTVPEIFEKWPDACFRTNGDLYISEKLRVVNSKLHRLGGSSKFGFASALHITEEVADED